MRALIVVLSFLLPCAAIPAGAQDTPALDIRAKRPLPPGKYAVDLADDSELGRDIRRRVLEKLAARGHDTGFSGSQVMRLQVDRTSNFDRGLRAQDVLAPPSNEVRPWGDRNDALPPMPERRLRDLEPPARVITESLRLTLTVRAANSGEVVWTAYAACPIHDGRALAAGRGMIDAIFAEPNRTRRDAIKCPP
jgi:hypothetical protein